MTDALPGSGSPPAPQPGSPGSGAPPSPSSPDAARERISVSDYGMLDDRGRSQWTAVRGEDGGQEFVRRDALDQRRQQQRPQQTGDLTADGRQGVRVGDRVFAPEELTELATRAAAEDVRKASLPASAADYRLELPAEFKLPAGVEITFAENDPILGPVIEQARNWAHAQGFSQEQFSSMLALHAGTLAHERDLYNQARAREIEALGPAASSRVTAVSTFLRATVGDDLARPLLATLVTAKSVEAFEKIANKMNGTVLSQAHRDPPPQQGLSDQAYEALSPRERYAYAQEATAAAASAPVGPRGRY